MGTDAVETVQSGTLSCATPPIASSTKGAESISSGLNVRPDVAFQGDGDAAPVSDTSAAMQQGTLEASRRQIAIVRQKSLATKSTSGPQPVFAEDIQIFSEEAEAILVKQTRSRLRVNRLKQGQAKGRRRDPNKRSDEKKIQLTFRMMLGVRVSIGRQAHPLGSHDLQEEDFAQVDKYTFPPAGATGRLPTPSHKLDKTFKFRDYSPKVFKKLRELFGIDESSYMLSVAGDYDYLELITNSKSGSFFFYSHDQRYVIKNMKRAEAKFFRTILPQYYEHHCKHPESMLIRFCGMYLVKNGRRKIPFIVMMCVEGGTKKIIHQKYDLKGSKVHRTAKEGEKVLKDNDLETTHGKVHLGSQREAFLKIVRADAEFLCKVNVMDYSILMSVHDTSVQEAPQDRRPLLDRGYTQFFTFADEASGRSVPEFAKVPSNEGPMSAVQHKSVSMDSSVEKATLKTWRSRSENTAQALRYTSDGGIVSEGTGPKEIYWMGIIDVLQQYTTLKHAETWYKMIKNKRGELSCVEPRLYYERFVAFMEKHTD